MLRRLFLACLAFPFLSLCSDHPLVIHHSRSKLFHDNERFIDQLASIRPTLAKVGIYLDTSFTLDMNWPTCGGYKNSPYPLFQYLYDLNCQIQTKPMLHYSGGTFFINFQYHGGAHPTQDYVHDFMVFDSISAPNVTQLAELWYRQSVLDDTISIKFGKSDAIEEFAFTENANYLLNSAYETLPTIVDFPTYPNPATGVVLSVMPNKDWILSTAIFDGSLAEGKPTGRIGPTGFFNNLGSHAFLITQITYQWPGKYSGSLIAGGWGNTAKYKRFDGLTQRGLGGGYLLYNQSIIPAKELKGFFQWGFSNREVSDASQFFSCGLLMDHILHLAHVEDLISIGLANSYFSHAKGSPYKEPFEMSIEVTYRCSFLEYIYIQPDLQYIIHPGGNGDSNALVATISFKIDI